MGELWQDLVETLRQRPALWAPVLLADLLGYLLNLGRNGLLRAIVLHETAQRSALGGAVVHTQMSASAMQTTTILALLISWLTYFLRILLYSTAFVATAALVQSTLGRRNEHQPTIGGAVQRHRGGILELALRGLAVYALAALVFSWLTTFLSKHGHTTLLHSPWFGYGLTLLVLLVLSALLPPTALRVLAGKAPERPLVQLAQQFSFILVIVASLLASFVGSNSRQMAQVPLAARYPLELIGSLVVALPYVLLFTGLSLLARRVRTEQEEVVA